MDVTREKVDELLKLVHVRYPDWTGFSDERFIKDETEYKRHTAAKAQELLAESELRRLVEEHNWDELIARVVKVGQATNLLYLAVPAQGDMAIVHSAGLDKQAFGTAFTDLLYGADTSSVRLGRFAQYLRFSDLPSKWTFATYFLFLVHPETEMFVKPSVVSWLLEWLGSDVRLTSELSPDVYSALRQGSTQMLELLANRGAKDMIDVQSILWVASESGNISYWKIQPGQDAAMWPTWQDGQFISIGEQGWDGVGDMSQMTRSDFNAKWRSLGLKRSQADIVWLFRAIRRGDRVVANHGFSVLLGVGTVTGSYYYAAGEPQPHRVPVNWDDTTRRSIKSQFWLKTLMRLDRRAFSELITPLSAVPVQPTDVNRQPVAKDELPRYFTERTFDLLAQLHQNPNRDFYVANREDLKSNIDLPLRRLLADVAAQMPAAITDLMETEKRIIAQITKNDFGRGGTWDYYWGAFYLKGGKRIADAQLFVWMDRSRFECGFYVGEYGSAQRERFVRNCRDNRDALLRILKDKLPTDATYGKKDDYSASDSDGAPRGADVSLPDWLKAPGEHGVHAAVSVPAGEVVASTAAQLQDRVSIAFRQFFPLVLLAVSDDPMNLIRDFMEAGEDSDDSAQPVYSLDDLAREVSIDRTQLAGWVRAWESKGQAVIYGPPGTGKTFVAERLARYVVAGGYGFSELVQFHPAYAYEDFIQGIRPESRSDGGLRYPMVPGRFLDFCNRARVVKGKCVLIVDEINRANLARVFGELMYLLEYRDRAIPLAGGGLFGIPPNVRIIGTMNTADRSIALVDHALRRRFAFIPLYPEYGVLERFHVDTGFPVQRLVEVLKELNAKVGDKHYWVGITFFLVKDLSDRIGDIWRMEIEPYLEEYFFDQQDKAESFRWDKVESRILKG